MKKLVCAILLISSPAWAQTKSVPKRAATQVDNCAPIGRSADGQLAYSVKCENVPAPPPPRAEVKEAPPAQSDTGLFGFLFGKK